MQINNNDFNEINMRLLKQQLAVQSTPLTISIVGAGGKSHLVFWLAQFYKQQNKQVCVTTTTKMYLPTPSNYDHIIALNTSNKVALNAKYCAPSVTFIYSSKISNQEDNNTIKVKGLSISTLQQIQQSYFFDIIIIEADGAQRLPIKAPAIHEPCIPLFSNIVIAVTSAEVVFAPADKSKIHRWCEFSSVTGCLENTIIDAQVLAPLLDSPNGMYKNAPSDARRIWVINKYDLCQQPAALYQLASKLLVNQQALSGIWLTQLNDSFPIKKVLTQ